MAQLQRSITPPPPPFPLHVEEKKSEAIRNTCTLHNYFSCSNTILQERIQQQPAILKNQIMPSIMNPTLTYVKVLFPRAST